MDIVEEIRQDREKGAKRLESEYKAGLMALACRFCDDSSDAAELVNATFATVVEKIDDYLEQSAFFGWMCQILMSHLSRNVRRKSSQSIVYPGVVPEMEDEGAQEEIYCSLDRSLVRDALQKLEPEDRELLLMHYFLDIPIVKMARVLSIPAGTVKSRLHYARKALAAKLGLAAGKAREAAKKPGGKAVLLALALCVTAALGAAGVAAFHAATNAQCTMHDAQCASPGVPRSSAAAIGGTGKTGGTGGYSLFAPVTAPVPPDSLVATTPTPVPPDSPVPPVINQSLLSKETTMNTTLRSLAASAAFAAATAATPMTGSGADWYVSPGGTGGGTSTSDRGDLMDVLYGGQVAAGDTIHLAVGTYDLDVSKSPEGGVDVRGYGGYLLAKVDNLTFIGESDNPEDVRLVGRGSTDQMRIFVVYNGGCVLRNLFMTGGYTIAQGAGICIASAFVGNPEAAFTASNCVVENCSAAYQGGGVFGGLLRDCVIRNNEVRNKDLFPEGSAGGVFHATLYDCVITNNYAGLCGGGIAAGRQNGATSSMPICETKAYNCLIGWNRSVYGGGAGVAPGNVAREYCQLFGCTLVENAAEYDAGGEGGGLGGGAYQCVVSNCVIRGNASTRPTGFTFSAYGHDYTYGAGGGVMDCEVVDSVIEGNTSSNGGAGAACSSLTGCEILNNAASGEDYRVFGGGAFGSFATNCVLAGNSAKYGGGAFEGYLENCVISNNYAYAAEGGATYGSSTRNCIVVGNRAAMYYALCKGSHYGDLVYGNSNEKIDELRASGIGSDPGEAEAVAVNCTVWGNDNSSAQVSRTTMTNCIAGSVEDIPSAVNSFWRSGTVANQTNCISGDDKNPWFEGVAVTDHPTVIVGYAPDAFAIKPGSPCRDKGLLLAGQRSETDLLGNPRVKYEGVDMGALECVGGVPFTMVIR